MSYKGAASTLPTTGGSGASGALVAGDMWKVSSDISIPANKYGDGTGSSAVTAKVGDLIIVNSNEKWDIVPSGDDHFVNIATSTNTFTVQDGTSPIGQISLSNDSSDDTRVVLSGTAGNSNTLLSISATLPTLTTTASGIYANVDAAVSGTVTLATDKDVITGLTIDNYGRVTGYKKAKYVEPTAQTLTITPATSNGTGTLSFSLSGDATEHKLSSDSLTIDGTANNATIELTWGSFT